MSREKIMQMSDQRPFSMIYYDFMDCELLDTFEKIVFIALKRFSDRKNSCFPSLARIATITGLSKRKVQTVLGSLKEKGIVTSQTRTRPDGGQASNLYILHDTAAMWTAGSAEEMKAAAEESEIDKAKRILEASGFTVTKEENENELESQPAKDDDQAQNKNTKDEDNTIQESEKSQEKYLSHEYSMTAVKESCGYSMLKNDYPEQSGDIEAVFSILHDTLNTKKKTIRINGEDKSAMVVKSKLLKLQPPDIIFAVRKFNEQTDRIKNPRSYLLTILYTAHEQNYLDTENLGHHNGAF